MPLSKERDRDRKRLAKLESCKFQPKIAGLVMQGNRILSVDKNQADKSRLETDEFQPKLPICNEYNFRQFKPGDKVLVRRGKRLVETVIPELDADGNAVPAWG